MTEESPKRRSRAAARVLAVVCLALVTGAAALTGFLVGQGTREAGVPAAGVQVRIDRAVARAVSRKSTVDHRVRVRLVRAAERRLARRHRAATRVLVERLTRAADARAAGTYVEGTRAGFASGRTAGVAQGLKAAKAAPKEKRAAHAD